MHRPLLNVEDETIQGELARICAELLETTIIDPQIKILDISVSCLRTASFDSFKERTTFVVSVQTNDASMVRGDANLYKGSYKERIEAVLDFCAKSILPGVRVHLEIEGPNPDSVEQLIPVDRLISSKRLTEDSPIVETARRFSIPDILVRGRHLIAPSPTIALYLDSLLKKASIHCAVDLFGGTGLTAKVLCSIDSVKHVTVVEHQIARLERMREHLKDLRVEFVRADAFKYEVKQSDLVVADPYYEDALPFLDAKLEDILSNAKIFIFVPGKVEDLRWNREVERKLTITGSEVSRFDSFGQVLFDIRAHGQGPTNGKED